MVAPTSDFDIQPRRGGPRKVRVNREARTARILLYTFPVLIVSVVVVPRLLLNSGYVKTQMAGRLAEEVSRRAHSSVRRLGGVTFGWAYDPCLQASEIYRVKGQFEVSAGTKSACVERWPSAVGSGFRAVQVKLERPSLRLVGGQTIVDAPPPTRKTKSSSIAVQHAQLRRPPLREIEVLFEDLTLVWSDMPLPSKIAAGEFGPIDGSVTLQKRGSKSAASIDIREPLTGMTIKGRATPTAGGWDLTARVEGDLAPSFGALFKGAGLDIRRLPVLGEIGAFYSAADSRIRMDIDLTQFNVDIANRLVSSKRLKGFEAHQKIRINVDLEQQRLWITDGLFEVNGVAGVVNVDVRLGGDNPSFLVGAELRTTPMIKLLRSIPGTEFPDELKDMSSGAQFAMKYTMSGELRDPTTWQMKLEHSVAGIEGVQGSGLEYLTGPFTYYPLTKKGRSEVGRPAGPGTEQWVDYARIPYAQRRAIQVSEDANFFLHNGLDVQEIQAALVGGLTSGDKTRGGSTLTQQLVKNLFLSRDRTAMRKVQELFITFLVESSMGKDQIFETYANMIEWGPNIYGLHEASYYYFARAPRQLSLKEMAYLASIIPGPILYHKYYEDDRIPPKHLAKINFLLKRLRKLNTIKTDQELQTALDERIRFRKGSTPTAVPFGTKD